jgi:protein gp37
VSTSIEWTDHTLQPGIYGCSIASPACEHCYAATMAHRQAAMGNYPLVTAKRGTKGVHWTGEVRVDFDAIAPAFAKLPKRKPARVFVTSMADLFHADVPWDFIGEVFRHMAQRPHLTFQVLTKRPDHMAEWYATTQRGAKWPAHIWAGTTVEDQRRADERIPHLLKVPARVRFLSMEPLLGPVNLSEWIERIDHCHDCRAENPPQGPDRCPECGHEFTLISTWGHAQAERYRSGERYNPDSAEGRADVAGTSPTISWVITGGESGPRARPSHPDWFRSLRDQCAAAGVPFFFKQWGEHGPATDRWVDGVGWTRPGHPAYPWATAPIERVGRAAAGRLLDGIEHSAFPEVA